MAKKVSARARLGAARRSTIRRQKKWKTAKGIFETAGTVASFIGSQAKKGETAWGEYEKGYEALGGEDLQRPKFGQKGFFKGPSGEVTINKKAYDAGQVRKAGAFLGSDASSVLSDDQRSKYLQRVAPGRTDATTFTGGFGTKTGDIGVGGGFGQGTGHIGFQLPDITSQHTPSKSQERQYRMDTGANISGTYPSLTGGTGGGFQGTLPKRYTEGEFLKTGETERSGMVFNKKGDVVRTMLPEYSMDTMSGVGKPGFKFQGSTSQYAPSQLEQQQYRIKGDISQKRLSDWQEAGSPIDSPKPREIRGTDSQYAPEQIPVQDQSQSFLQKMQQGITQKFSDIGVKKWQEGQYRKSIWEREDPDDPNSPYKSGSSYAKGGSFVTNGPQMIMVGDNPGGREAVNVVPLDSEDDRRDYLKKRFKNNSGGVSIWDVKKMNNDYWNK